jgi:hypothetical protein
MNKSEELVAKHCTKSFLSLWSYPNPRRGKDSGKELCDVLLVCEPDVIIFSVKEKDVTDSGDISVDWSRWHKRAVEESCKQICGAERSISNSSLFNFFWSSRKMPKTDVRMTKTFQISTPRSEQQPLTPTNSTKSP